MNKLVVVVVVVEGEVRRRELIREENIGFLLN
jgi:hypothetical protein